MAPSHLVKFDNRHKVTEMLKAPPAVEQYFLRTHALSEVRVLPKENLSNKLFTFHVAKARGGSVKITVATLNLENPAALKEWYADWFQKTWREAHNIKAQVRLFNLAAVFRWQEGRRRPGDQEWMFPMIPMQNTAASAWPPKGRDDLDEVVAGPRTPGGSRHKFEDGRPQEWWDGYWYRARPSNFPRPKHRVAPPA